MVVDRCRRGAGVADRVGPRVDVAALGALLVVGYNVRYVIAVTAAAGVLGGHDLTAARVATTTFAAASAAYFIWQPLSAPRTPELATELDPVASRL